MEKNARRKIISEKSEYLRKPPKWNFRDELQFRTIMRKLNGKPIIFYYYVRDRVKLMLEKYGYKASHVSEGCYLINKLK